MSTSRGLVQKLSEIAKIIKIINYLQQFVSLYITNTRGVSFLNLISRERGYKEKIVP